MTWKPKANLRGPRGAEGSRGDRGLPGVLAVENDEAVATYLAAPGTKTRTALDSTLAATPGAPRKQIRGGNFPKPARFPTLTIADQWPNPRSPFDRILWVENRGQTLYGLGSDGVLRKSTDRGASWESKAYMNWAPALQNIFLKTASGTLLTISTGGGIWRSTDDGGTWSQVGSVQAGQTILGTQSWTINPLNGHIYLGMYDGRGQTVMNLYRSTDDGATWPVFHAFPGTASPDANRITHIHAVQWDHVDKRVVISTGDSSPGSGLYRTTADGSGIEPLVLNRMLPVDLFDAPRSIGIMPFPDYIAWASDSTTSPFLFRIARSEIGKTEPVIERVYRLNSTAWWTCQASADGSRWVISASQENADTQIDRLVHLYAVEDQGATVYEIGTLPPTSDTSPAGSMMPVGQPTLHDETFFMAARTAGAQATWKFRMGLGAGVSIPWPKANSEVVAWKTVNSGAVDLASGASMVFAIDRAPAKMPVLYVHDDLVSVLSGSAGTGVVGIRVKGQPEVYGGTAISSRYTDHKEAGGSIRMFTFSPGDQIEFVLRSTAVSGIKACGAVTYGWGLPPALA